MLERILLVEDNDESYNLLKGLLINLGYRETAIFRCMTLKDIDLMDPKGVDLVLMDLGLPDSKCTETFTHVSQRFPYSPIIVLTGTDEIETAIDTIKQGAQDYLIKGELDCKILHKAIQYAVERKKVLNSYLVLFEENPCPMYIYDSRDHHFLAVNTAALHQYGYEKDHFLRLTALDIRPPEDVPQFLKANEKISWEYNDAGQWRHINKDGAVFYVHVYCYPIQYMGRTALLALVLNVDKKVKAEIANERLNTKIREQKEQIDEILASVKEVIWSCTLPDLNLVYINDAALNIYGYHPSELINNINILFDQIHPEDLPKVYAEIENILRTGTGALEYRITHRDGSLRYILNEAVLKKGDGQKPDILNGVAIDISKISLAEQALQEKAKQVENILESITDGFFTVNTDSEFRYINKEFERIMQRKKETLIGKNIWACFPEARQLKFYTEFEKAIHERVTAHFEEYYYPLGIWLSVNVYPTKTGAAVYMVDITGQKAIQEKLFIDQENLRATINNTQDIIWSMDRNLNIISANDAFWNRIEKITGVPKEKIKEEHFTPSLFEEWRKQFERAFSGELYKTVRETPWDGETVHEEISFNPIYNKEKEIIGVSCFSRDITAQINYQKKLEEKNKKLQDIAWLQSHKVRGPVASILGLVQLFNFNDPFDAINAQVVERINTAAHMLDDSIKEITAHIYDDMPNSGT